MNINLKSKRGQSLSMNVIIIAILALLVLVVLSLIFIRNQDDFDEKANANCRLLAIGAKCVDTASDGHPGNKYVQYTKANAFNDCEYECYVPVGSDAASD